MSSTSLSNAPPRPAASNGSIFVFAFSLLGIFFGLFIREIIDGPPSISTSIPPTSDFGADLTPKVDPQIAFMATVVEGLKSPTPAPTRTPKPAMTPDPRHPTATPTIQPPPCTLTPSPGTQCDVAPWPVSAATPTTFPDVICDIILQTPDPYHNMPGRFCTWATSTPSRPAAESSREVET